MKLSTRSLLLIVGSLACLLFSILAEVEAPQETTRHILSLVTLSELLRELSFALGIAFVLIATVELESRRELSNQVAQDLELIKENVFNATFRRSFPQEVLQEIEHLIFKQNFVRLDHECTYVLTLESHEINGALKKMVRMAMTSRSVIKNISFRTHDFPIAISAELPPFPALQDKLEIKLLGVQIEGEPRQSPSFEIKDADGLRTGTYLARNIPSGKNLSVDMTMSTFKVLNDYEVWRTLYPTSALRVNVHFPLEAFRFGAASLHREQLSGLATSRSTMTYKFNGAVLPHQGLVFWWCCDDLFSHHGEAKIAHLATSEDSTLQPRVAP